MEYTPEKKTKKKTKSKTATATATDAKRNTVCDQKAQSEPSSLLVSFTEKPTTDVSVYKLITETRSLIVISCYKYNTAGYIYFACIWTVCVCVSLSLCVYVYWFICINVQFVCDSRNMENKMIHEQIERVGHTIYKSKTKKRAIV